jgi:type IV pilus assembly protein PilE
MTVLSATLKSSRKPAAVRRRQRGFTLVELMVAVAVMGILSAIAYPSYSSHVRQSRTADAVALLALYQLSMEQASQDNGNYGVETCAVTVPAATPYFELSCVLGAGGQTYVATATGTNAMTGNTYTINEAGTKKTTAFVEPVTLPAACWLTREGDC